MSPVLLVVTGLQREAAIAAGEGVVTLCSGGNVALLRERLDALIRPQGDVGFAGVLSFGLAGGLSPDVGSGDVVLATHVTAINAHYEVTLDWQRTMTARLAGTVKIHSGAIAGTESVLTKSADKAALHAVGGAIAVDMESHIAADYAARHKLPFAALRAIGDPVTRSLPPLASDALRDDGSVDVLKVIRGLAGNPGQLSALIAAGIDSERAFASLRRCRRLLGPLFGLGGAHL